MPKPQHHVLVCLNSRPADNPKGSCAAKGAEALYDRLRDIVKASGLRDSVIVNRTSCLKHCSRGTTVAVYPENVWYGRAVPADAEEIVKGLEQGQPIERLLMPDIPWE
jgi:(2Fe-2S) ferredoxin